MHSNLLYRTDNLQTLLKPHEDVKKTAVSISQWLSMPTQRQRKFFSVTIAVANKTRYFDDVRRFYLLQTGSSAATEQVSTLFLIPFLTKLLQVTTKHKLLI